MFDNPEIPVIGAADSGQQVPIIQYNSYAVVQKNLGPRILKTEEATPNRGFQNFLISVIP
jgi:hypothetical protein